MKVDCLAAREGGVCVGGEGWEMGGGGVRGVMTVCLLRICVCVRVRVCERQIDRDR